MDRQKVEDIARKKINKDHTLGESVGGSGHIGYTALENLEVKEIKSILKENKKYWEIAYEYTLVTETEFTIAPDHPPYTNKYSKVVVVDNEGNVVEDYNN